jgi:hypothetical protein
VTPNLLDELEGVVRLMEAASFVDLDWGWRRDDDDTPGSMFTRSFGGAHQAVAMCPRYGRDNFAADAPYLVALHNFLRTHAPALADMAKRMEAAERDARRYALIKKRFDDMTTSESERFLECLGIDGDVYQPLDAAIDATQEGEG